MVYNLQSKELEFVRMLFRYALPTEVLMHFLNDPWFRQVPAGEPNYILRSYLARSSNEKLPMHIDSFVPYGGDHVFVMQMSIILEDQTAENGCTLVVPGSHKRERYAAQESFEEAVPVESSPGDVVIWDSRLWHGTEANRSTSTRWALIATFTRWWLKQAFDIPRNVPQSIYAQLTASEKAVLGYCSVPYRDETLGIDMKRGYDSFAEHVEAYRN